MPAKSPEAIQRKKERNRERNRERRPTDSTYGQYKNPSLLALARDRDNDKRNVYGWRSGKTSGQRTPKYLFPARSLDGEGYTLHYDQSGNRIYGELPEDHECTLVDWSIEELKKVERVTCPHYYYLLHDSEGHFIEAPAGDGNYLRTRDIFEFLLSLPPDKRNVGFSLKYDIAMWLKDVDVESLRELQTSGVLVWPRENPEYKIQWTGNKREFQLWSGPEAYTKEVISWDRRIGELRGLPSIESTEFLQSVRRSKHQELDSLVERHLPYLRKYGSVIAPNRTRPKYQFEWDEGNRTLTVYGGNPEKVPVTRYRWERSFKINDTFGFFQCSFVEALKKYRIADQQTIERIAEMKGHRSWFGNTDEAERDRQRAYCAEENRYMVDLYHVLKDAAGSVGIELKRLDGAGSLAGALLKKHRVEDFIVEPPGRWEKPARIAYLGGRFDTARTGLVEHVWSYDLNSAYPAIQQDLPSLVGMKWIPAKEYDAACKWAIWHVEWNTPPTHPWAPFPLRSPHDGRLRYIHRGRGWYHAEEVRAAIEVFGPEHFTVLEGVKLIPGNDDKPFSWIPEVYGQRLKYKDDGNLASEILKFGINSLYGKTAQREGAAPFRSFVWAGMITAGTRAAILRALAHDPTAVVEIATDGIISKRPLPLDIGKGLGQWKETQHDAVFLVQSGIYQYKDQGVWLDGEVEIIRDGKSETPIPATRGFSARECRENGGFDRIRECYAEDCFGKFDAPSSPGGSGGYKVTRFVGLGAAAYLDFPAVFGNWVTSWRQLQFFIPSKSPVPGSEHLFEPSDWTENERRNRDGVDLYPLTGPEGEVYESSVKMVPFEELEVFGPEFWLQKALEEDQPL
jgi:hypothetical protein